MTGDGMRRPWSLAHDDAMEVEALVADRYLDALLAGAERRAADVPADLRLEPVVRGVALTLQRGLVRVHPSFRFEERLASRLDAFARASLGTGPGGELVTLPQPATARIADDPDLVLVLEGRLDPAASSGRRLPEWAAPARPILVGGAITSAAISLVGVAWMAWRASRTADPLVRALRAARGRGGHADGRLPFLGGAGGPA
jgi:hypothetical protein